MKIGLVVSALGALGWTLRRFILIGTRNSSSFIITAIRLRRAAATFELSPILTRHFSRCATIGAPFPLFS